MQNLSVHAVAHDCCENTCPVFR